MRAYGERVLVKKVLESPMENGIILSKEKIYNGVVEVVSIGGQYDGELLMEGDKLKLTEGAGAEVKVDGELHLSILKNHIIGVM